MTRKKYHHFRPVLHLRTFADPRLRLWVYDRLGQFAPVRQALSRVGGQNYLYAPEAGLNPTDDQVEEWLARSIDDPASAPLSRIIENQPISSREKSAMARYLAVQDMRTPKTRDTLVPMFQAGLEDWWAKTTADLPSLRDEIAKSTGTTYSLDQLEELVTAHSVQVTKAVWLSFLLDNVNFAAQRVFREPWMRLLTPADEEFFTNDVGIVKFAGTMTDVAPFALGFAAGRTHWVMPLSPNVALALGPRLVNGTTGKVQSRWLTEVNQQIAMDASRFVYTRTFSSDIERWWRDHDQAA